MFIIGRRKIEDEKIISALLSNTTVNSAADEIGCNPSVIYARRKDATFLRKLQQAQDDALSGTVRYLQSSMARMEIVNAYNEPVIKAKIETVMEAVQAIVNNPAVKELVALSAICRAKNR